MSDEKTSAWTDEERAEFAARFKEVQREREDREARREREERDDVHQKKLAERARWATLAAQAKARRDGQRRKGLGLDYERAQQLLFEAADLALEDSGVEVDDLLKKLAADDSDEGAMVLCDLLIERGYPDAKITFATHDNAETTAMRRSAWRSHVDFLRGAILQADVSSAVMHPARLISGGRTILLAVVIESVTKAGETVGIAARGIPTIGTASLLEGNAVDGRDVRKTNAIGGPEDRTIVEGLSDAAMSAEGKTWRLTGARATWGSVMWKANGKPESVRVIVEGRVPNHGW